MEMEEDKHDSPTSPLLHREKTVIEHLLPEPSHPRAKYRTISSSILLLLILIPLWLVVFDARNEGEGLEDEIPEEGIAWVDFKGVSWGSSSSSSSEEVAGSTTWGEEYGEVSDEEELQVEEEIDWDTEDDIVLPKFSEEKVQSVEEMRQNGSFGNYVWHETLQGLNATKEKAAGRLIVVGDLHGSLRQLQFVLSLSIQSSSPMTNATSLRSLLHRISYSPETDTLLHTGDIISKSPLNDSLATLKLVRELGLKGVRGNHDQGVLEWRAWMESFGALDLGLPVTGSGSGKGKERVGLGSQGLGTGKSGPKKAHGKEGEDKTAEEISEGAPDTSDDGGEAEESDGDEKKRRKRWFRGGGSKSEPVEVDAEVELPADLEITDEELVPESTSLPDDGETDYIPADVYTPKVDEEVDEEIDEEPLPTLSSSSKNATLASSPKNATLPSSFNSTLPHRPSKAKPNPTLPHSSNSTHSQRPSISKKPSALDEAHGVSHASLQAAGALLGTDYKWLTVPATKVSQLGIQVPEGWEWGGQWFELARHMEGDDVEYLKNLPMTLWIEEVRAYLVHAGLVPWEDAEESTANEDDSAIPATLSSTSLTDFVPTSKAEKNLNSNSRASLLLVEQNTSPYSLQNLRTLVGRTKKPSKGKKGIPWYSIWNREMTSCRKRDGCEDVNVIYGHWAGKGLTVEVNSIGLDTACYKGEQLTALVVPLSMLNDTVSPLSSNPAKSGAAAYRVMSNTTATPLDDLDFSTKGEKGVRRGSINLKKRRMDGGVAVERRGRFGVGVVPSSGADDESDARKAKPKQPFKEREVELNGKQGWVVSVECS